MVELPSNIIELADEDEYNNLLIYGDSGVGKTVLAGSDDDVLFIAPEDNGTLSAKRFGSTAKKWKVREGAEGWDDVVAAYEWLYTLDTIPFNWVVLDSLTEMQSMCMRWVLAKAVEERGGDQDIPDIRDWQPYYNKFQRMVKAFNSLPVNMLYTALQQEDKNEDEESYVLPMIQGKGTQYSKLVCGWMTSFGNMKTVRKKVGEVDGKPQYEEQRVIQWHGTKTVMAKDRTRCLAPRTIIGPSHLNGLKDIRELLESGPKQPAPGRVPPNKTDENKAVRKPAEDRERLRRRPTSDAKAEVVAAIPDESDNDDELSNMMMEV